MKPDSNLTTSPASPRYQRARGCAVRRLLACVLRARRRVQPAIRAVGALCVRDQRRAPQVHAEHSTLFQRQRPAGIRVREHPTAVHQFGM